MPTFVDGKDDLDAYLERFERYATKEGWKKDEWADDLSALLTGDALYVYSKLAISDARNYNKLKEAILKRYQLTEEGFRTKFRESRPEIGESSGQYITRLGNYLTRWMNLLDVKETYDDLRRLFIMEQFMS